jgi:hypothetical protein
MTVVLRVIRNDASIGASRPVRARAERVFPAIVEPIVEPLETVVAHSIEQLGRREWDSLFPNELEDWRYLRALERAQVEHCEPIYFAIRSRGRLVAAAPAFVGRRALAEPWRVRARAHWRRSPARALVLGSPLAAAGRIGFASRTTTVERRLLAGRLLRAACDESALRGLDGLLVDGDADALGQVGQQRESLRLACREAASTARISLPRWSLSDYLSCLDDALRARLLRTCARSGRYERDWHVDLDHDIGPMLALCRDAGLEEIGEPFFRALLGSSAVSAECLLVRSGDGSLAGFSIVLHDVRALREKLTVLSRHTKGTVVRGVIWLETLRFCLERGIGVYESASELSLAAAHPTELVQRSRWIAAHDVEGVASP